MVVEICLFREEYVPWGFRLIGGVEFKIPLTVVKVTPGSVAHEAGLCDGDIITRIDSIPAHQLSHREAQYVINEASDQIYLTVVRGRSNLALIEKYSKLLPECETPDYNYAPAYDDQRVYDQTDEVSDAELRAITASPFQSSEPKRYRPFSTEPIEGVPPLEQPIILSPYYKDDFGCTKKDETESDTVFKLPKSPAALMFSSNTNNETNHVDNLYLDYDEYMSKAYQKYVTEISKENVSTNETKTLNESSQNYAANTLESERLNIYEQIQALNENYRAENEEQINSEYINETIPTNLESTMEIKNVAKHILQDNLAKVAEKTQNEYVVEYNEKIETKSEHQEMKQKPDPLITYVATVEHSERVIKTPTIIEQSEIIVEETNVINESTEITKTIESVRNSPVVVEPHKTEQKTTEVIKEIKKEDLEEKSSKVNIAQEQSKQKQIDNFIDKSQIKEKLTESIAKHVNEKQNVESTEKSTKATKSTKEVREEAVSVANLLTEQARMTWLQSQTIPSLQYSVQSTYHYDLLLKTFFVHLTDVMVALSRFIMTETPSSILSSSMSSGQTAQSTRQQVLEKILAQKATQTDDFYQTRQKEAASQMAEEKVVSKREELVDEKVAKIAEVVSQVGTKEILAKKSEASLKIESLLGQKDPLEWLAEKDEVITKTSVMTTVTKEVSENQAESLVKEQISNTSELVAQEEIKEEMKVVVEKDLKEEEKVAIQEEIKEEAKEEIKIAIQEKAKEETKAIDQEEMTEEMTVVVKKNDKEKMKDGIREDISEELNIVIQGDIKEEPNIVVEDITEEMKIVVHEDIKEETNVAVREELKEDIKVMVHEELEAIEEKTQSQEEVSTEKLEENLNMVISSNEENIKVTDAEVISKVSCNNETEISEQTLDTKTLSAESTQIISESKEIAIAEDFKMVSEAAVSENVTSSMDINVSGSVSKSQKAIKDESMIVEQNVEEEFQSTENRRESVEVVESYEKMVNDDKRLKSILKKTQISENIEVHEVHPPQLKPDENNNLPTPVEITPPTPLTDEYVFRLDVYVPGLKRSSSKSPDPNPETEPQTLHEDPHIVKKPKFKASIDTKIESVIFKPDGDTKDVSTVDGHSVESELVQEMFAKESLTEESLRASETVKSTTEQTASSQKTMKVSAQFQKDYAEFESVDRESESIVNGSMKNGVSIMDESVFDGSVRSDSVLNGTIQNDVDIMVHNVTEEEVGKPGLSEETIAELISGEAEVLKEAHVIGLKRVLASHMTRTSEDEDDEISSVNFKKIKPQIGTLKDSEVVKVLNEDILKTKEEKKKEERRWTTFLQKPNRPVPKVAQSKWGQAYDELQSDYKVQIVKQPKPKIAPDAPKDYNTGPLPWEERQANEPLPEPIQQEEPILVPEEAPQYLEAVDPLPESEVPDLEDTGLPLPPEPVFEEVAEPIRFEEVDTETEVEAVSEVEQLKESAEEEEIAQTKLAAEVLNNLQNMADGDLSLEEQLAQVQAQLSALAQIPAAIQQTLDAVTKKLSKIVPQQNGHKQVPISNDIEQSEGNIAENEGQTDAENYIVEEVDQVAQHIQNGYDYRQNGEAIENGFEDKFLEPVLEETQVNGEELQRNQQQELVILDEQRRIEQQKKELISELEFEHSQRQVKQRPTGRVGHPKPVFGPLTPQERPVVLPGGRRWRGPKDAFNDQLIAETLSAQAEVIKGKAIGSSYESPLLPYDQRINFMKYEKPPKSLDHLKESSVYKMVHDMDEEPLRGVEGRPPLVIAESEFREKCRSVTPNLDGPKF